jgi:hypothetical protein
MAEQMTSQERIAALEKKLALLERIADKSKLARLTPEEEKGMSIRVPLYRTSLTDEPKLIKSWRMLFNDVRVTKQFGEQANQVVEITLFDGADGEKPDLRGLKMQLGKAKTGQDELRIEELTKRIEEAEKAYSNVIELQLEDFGKLVSSEEVKVIATEERSGTKFYSFLWNEKEHKIAVTYVNP